MSKLPAFLTSLTILLVSAQAAALPGNVSEGKKLHEANCLSCHDDGVYKRKDRKVRNLEALTQQLNNCSHAIDSTLEKAQISDLLKYLNENFYKFK